MAEVYILPGGQRAETLRDAFNIIVRDAAWIISNAKVSDPSISNAVLVDLASTYFAIALYGITNQVKSLEAAQKELRDLGMTLMHAMMRGIMVTEEEDNETEKQERATIQ